MQKTITNLHFSACAKQFGQRCPCPHPCSVLQCRWLSCTQQHHVRVSRMPLSLLPKMYSNPSPKETKLPSGPHNRQGLRSHLSEDCHFTRRWVHRDWKMGLRVCRTEKNRPRTASLPEEVRDGASFRATMPSSAHALAPPFSMLKPPKGKTFPTKISLPCTRGWTSTVPIQWDSQRLSTTQQTKTSSTTSGSPRSTSLLRNVFFFPSCP